MLTSELIRDVDALDEWRGQWDELAVDAGRPFCSPGWMLAWWSDAAPARSELAVVIVREARTLLGLAPWYVDRTPLLVPRVRALASGTCMRAEPLARPGRQAEAAEAFANTLARETHLDALRFEGVPSDSPWPKAARDHWPGGRIWSRVDVTRRAPYVPISEGTFEGWFSNKSRNFRQQMGRARRRISEKGAVLRLLTEGDDVETALRNFARLHHERWAWRGGSGVLNARVERMLRSAARALLPQSRFRLFTMEVDGKPISSHLFLAAGGEVCYWLGGFDPAWASERPAMVTLLAALEDAWGRGDRRFDLGGGDQPYKYRFAEADETLEWWTLAPRGRRYPLVRTVLFPQHAYRWAARHVPEGWRGAAKKLVPRAPSWAR